MISCDAALPIECLALSCFLVCGPSILMHIYIPVTSKKQATRFNKATISVFAYNLSTACAVNAQLIGAFVLASRIVQSFYLLNSNFQASSHLLWLHLMGDLTGNPEDSFSHIASYYLIDINIVLLMNFIL